MTTPGYDETPRARLDAIRELVLPDAKVRGRACPCCGYRWPYAPCPLCGGQPVRAANLLRSVGEIARAR
jgi:hypothetical protein